jgi:hypothetical protein
MKVDHLSVVACGPERRVDLLLQHEDFRGIPRISGACQLKPGYTLGERRQGASGFRDERRKLADPV